MPEHLDAEVAEHQRRLRYWVHTLRAERGWSQALLMRFSGLSKTGLKYALAGAREPGIRTLLAIARALEVDLCDLFRPIPDGAVEPGDEDGDT